MQNELKKDSCQINEINDLNDQKFEEDTDLLQTFFYEAANNAINEIDLIYSDDNEERKYCIEILVKIFKNIIEHPENEKFFKFKISNKILQKIINFQSVLDLLCLVGFKKSFINSEEYLELKEFDMKVFSTIYSFIMLLTSGEQNNFVYNCEEEKESVLKNNKMRGFMIETSYLRNNSNPSSEFDVVNNSNSVNDLSSDKMKNFLKETAELRKNMISDAPISLNKNENSSSSYKTLKSLPVNFSNNNYSNSNISWFQNNTSSNNSFNNRNNYNFESRVKYLSDFDFKNPDFNSINNPNFKVNDEIGKKCLELTNDFRRKHRMPLLKWNDKIWKICFEHSKNMGDHKVPFGHDGFNQRVNKVGFYFSAAFENVFMCEGYSQYDLAKIAVEGWINSPGHRKNLLSGSTDCAIAVYKNSYGYYYLTQIFMRT